MWKKSTFIFLKASFYLAQVIQIKWTSTWTSLRIAVPCLRQFNVILMGIYGDIFNVYLYTLEWNLCNSNGTQILSEH